MCAFVCSFELCLLLCLPPWLFFVCVCLLGFVLFPEFVVVCVLLCVFVVLLFVFLFWARVFVYVLFGFLSTFVIVCGGGGVSDCVHSFLFLLVSVFVCFVFY